VLTVRHLELRHGELRELPNDPLGKRPGDKMLHTYPVLRLLRGGEVGFRSASLFVSGGESKLGTRYPIVLQFAFCGVRTCVWICGQDGVDSAVSNYKLLGEAFDLLAVDVNERGLFIVREALAI
jgi:hypothetical protein